MKIFGFDPAVIAYAVNAAVALLVAYGLDLSQGQVEAVSVVTTAILAAVAAFGLELSAEQIGASVTALSIVLALLLRQNVSPAPVVAPARQAVER